TVDGVIEAEDRKAALQILTKRGLFPSSLEAFGGSVPVAATKPASLKPASMSGISFGARVARKDITAFTGEMSTLLGAAIPIPQALDGLSEEEENPVLKAAVQQISESVRKGAALSAAMDEHPKMFNKLYVSM